MTEEKPEAKVEEETVSKVLARTRASSAPLVFQQQADATLTQANPVSGTKYTVLAATSNVRLIGIETHVTWTVQPTPLLCVVTIDGIAYEFSVANPVSTTKYYVSIGMSAAEVNMALEATDRVSTGRPFLLEGRSVKVEIKTTGGTTSEIYGRVKYAKL